MALLAEQIVEEWLTRQGYFTIRGIKIGNDELDLLAIKRHPNGVWQNIHIEVQVSIRPVGYISNLTQLRQSEFKIAGGKSASKRSDFQLELAVKDWVDKKFKGIKKGNLRKQLTHIDNWDFLFVHGKVRDIKEIDFIRSNGIQTKHISEVITELQKPGELKFTTASATDIIELISIIGK